MILIKSIFLLISIHCLVEAYPRLSKIIPTLDGNVRGLVVRTVLRQMEYSSFRGIPYAEPPVKDLRFEPPVKFTRKSIPLHYVSLVMEDPNMCPQYDANSNTVLGNEDCLYLNVYTPEVEFKKGYEKRAVMVWIHGGAFMWGSNNSTKFGPDYLIEKNVVVVAMNYRLGALGFLAADDKIGGNMGLKDQVMALKWVRDNIAYFGGDPNKVTIFGESAGAVSVELHRLSPKSRGLFRASIAMSGSPLNPWAFDTRETAEDMSDEMIKLWSKDYGIRRLDGSLTPFEVIDENYKELLREISGVQPSLKTKLRLLKLASVDQIVRTHDAIMKLQMRIPFLPTVEKSGSLGAFLTKMPETLYQKRSFSSVPHVIGYTASEFIGITEVFKHIYSNLHDYINNFAEYTLSELGFYIGIDETLQYIKKKKNVTIWMYENSFDYPQSLHRIEGIDKDGCGHADDVAHIFYMQGKNQPLDFQSDFAKHRETIVTLWTNLAKYLNVTADTSSIGNIDWPPVKKNGYYLDFRQTPRRVRFNRGIWEGFVEDYLDEDTSE